MRTMSTILGLALVASLALVLVPEDQAEAALEACPRVAWRGTDGAEEHLYVVRSDGADRRNISAVGAEPWPTVNRSPDWSPDGSEITWRADQDIVVATSQGLARRVISDIGPGPAPDNNRDPQWSPDGSQIAWRGIEDSNVEIYVAGKNGDNRIRISDVGPDPDPTVNNRPRWSPDGSQIAWDGESSGLHVYVASADGTGRVAIDMVGAGPHPTGNAEPVWSPDGSMVAWYGFDAGLDLQVYVANADGTGRVSISDVGPDPDPTSNAEPAWSPDGTSIAWRGMFGGTAEIFVANPDGTSRTMISQVSPDPDPTNNGGPQWSVDSSELAWRGSDGTTSQIYIARADGTNRREVSTADDDPDPTNNQEVAWCNRGEPRVCPTFAPPLNDIGSSGEAFEAITCIWGLGITQGVTPTTYGPSAVVTRRQMASFLARLWRDVSITDSCDTSTPPFTDIPTSGELADDIGCIYGLDITQGTSPTTYGPADPVTRGQMARFLARLWRANGGACASTPTPFTDISGSIVPDVECIYDLAITLGTTPTTYGPSEPVTRLQMALFLARIWPLLLIPN